MPWYQSQLQGWITWNCYFPFELPETEHVLTVKFGPILGYLLSIKVYNLKLSYTQLSSQYVAMCIITAYYPVIIKYANITINLSDRVSIVYI